MNTRLLLKLVIPLISGTFMLFGSASVFAAAGDNIANRATINYDVGTVAQTLIESSPSGNTTPGATNGTDTVFVEDREINFGIADANSAYNAYSAGQTDAYLTFTLQNDSNQTLDFLLAAIDTDLDTYGGGADDIDVDAGSLEVYVEDGTTVGFQSAEDTAVFVDELAPTASVTVYIVGDIPASATNGQTAGYALVAQAAAGGTDTPAINENVITNAGAEIMRDDNGNISPAGTFGNSGNSRTTAAVLAVDVADTVGVMDTVFGDPVGGAAEDWSTALTQDALSNGQASDSDAFSVNAADLTITKTSAVFSDPVNGLASVPGNNPKAIPNAVIEYTLTIANGVGASDAVSVAITDDLDTQITAGSIAWVAASMVITSPDAGASVSLSDADDADEGEFNISQVNTVIVDCGTLSATESCTLTYQVTVE